jgi:hypothetical protein
MTSPITRFIRQVLGLMFKKKALRGMRHPDPHAGMPRSLRGVRP